MISEFTKRGMKFDAPATTMLAWRAFVAVADGGRQRGEVLGRPVRAVRG